MNFHLHALTDLIKTERAQVAFILFFVIVCAFMTIEYVVIPQHEMAGENLMVREQLAASRYANQSLSNLQAIAGHEFANIQIISNEWSRIAERMATFPNQTAIKNTEVNRIDYKVQLYEIRQRLQAKSDELKIPLVPTELGLDDVVASGEAIRVRMLQLRAVERLADLTLDRQIQRLVEIYPLDPVKHKDPKGSTIFEEYPVRVECDVDFAHLYTFFQSIFEEKQVFAFRNIRIESGPTFDSKLRVKAILSALLFE